MEGSMSKTLVILNPAARSTRAGGESGFIESLRDEAEVAFTSASGEARKLAARAVEEGYAKVVAAGGDGTINEVVNGLAGSGAMLGVLPMGTMNVFATEMGIPSDLKAAWEVIARGHSREIDLACANEQYFVQ